MDEEMRRMMEAYLGKKLENRKEMSPERKQELKEALQRMQKQQEERRRLKETDPEAYQKMIDQEWQSYREYLDSPDYLGSGNWTEVKPSDKKDKDQD